MAKHSGQKLILSVSKSYEPRTSGVGESADVGQTELEAANAYERENNMSTFLFCTVTGSDQGTKSLGESQV